MKRLSAISILIIFLNVQLSAQNRVVIDAHNEQQVQVELNGLSATTVAGRILRSDNLQDHNSFDKTEKVEPVVFTNATLNGNNLSVKIPPFSVVVLELK
jgi:alpha-L-arabinofuranosidase